MLGILFRSVQIILKDDLNMGQRVTKFMSMPHLLSEEKEIVSVLATTIKTGLKETQI
jgi:hypothetical protein